MNINKDNSLNSLVRISCHNEEGHTYLDDGYSDIPYKLTHYGNRNMTDNLELILMCSSPGTMDGDILRIELDAKKNSRMKLFTQSFNKIHQMPRKVGAKQYCSFKLAEGAFFQYIPHPTIPFANSIFYANNEIHMAGDAHLIWGDIISSGRVHSGESFQMDTYHTRTQIFRDKKLIFFDNQLISPNLHHQEEILLFEGFTHQGTLLIISPFSDDFKKELDEILLEQFEDSAYGLTKCADNALMIRILGCSGDGIFDWLQNIGKMAWSYFEYRLKEEQKRKTSEVKRKKDLPKSIPVTKKNEREKQSRTKKIL